MRRRETVFSALSLLASLSPSLFSPLLISLFATLVGRYDTSGPDPELLFRCDGDGGAHLGLVMSREFD